MLLRGAATGRRGEDAAVPGAPGAAPPDARLLPRRRLGLDDAAGSGGGRADDPHDDPDDDLDDLDARGPLPDDAGPRRRARSLRGLAAPLAVAVAAGALGAALTAHRQGAREGTVVRAEVARVAVQAGVPASTQPAVGSDDGAGWSDFAFGVPLTNRGTVPLQVAVTGLDVPGQRTALLPDPVVVDPGTTVTVPLRVKVRCDAFPASRALVSRTPRASVRARVTDPGARPSSQLVALPVPAPGPYGLSVVSQVTSACADDSADAVRVPVRTSVLDGGRLRVVLGAGPVPGSAVPPTARVALRTTAGLTVVSDPPLPADVPSGRVVPVVLTAVPDCAAVGDGRDARAVLVTTDAHGRTTGVVPDADGDLVAWVARQVALRCG